MIFIVAVGWRGRCLSAVAVVAALSAGACGGGGSEPEVPTATLQTAPLATTTTNPYAVPAVIDEAYVNRVLAGLDHSIGDIVRQVVTTKTFTRETEERFTAVYTGRHLQYQLDSILADLQGGLVNAKPSPGDQVTTVNRLITATPTCIFAEVHRDYSAVVIKESPLLSTQWVVLRPVEAVTARIYNPTGWLFSYDGFQADYSAPKDPCPGP